MERGAKGAMAPSALEPRRRNEVILTREEAMKRRVRKGYALEPIGPVADVDRGVEKIHEVDGRRRKSTGTVSKPAAEPPPVAIPLPVRAEERPSIAGSGGGSLKRKTPVADERSARGGVDVTAGERRCSRESSRDGGKGADSAEWTRGERRGLRRKFRDDLEQLQGLMGRVEGREGALMRAELAGQGGESRKRMKRAENGTVVAEGIHGGSLDAPSPLAGPAPSAHAADAQVPRGEADRSGKDWHAPVARPSAGVLPSAVPASSTGIPASDSFRSMGKGAIPERGKGKKITSGKALDLETRRQRIAVARGRRLNDILKQCATLLKRLMSHKYSWVFNTPVDAEKLGLHDYHTVIKRPMDLGTINSRLKTSGYQHPDEFYSDVQLVWANAMTYNGEGSDVYTMTVELKGVFEQAYRKIRPKVDEDAAKRRQEDQEVRAAEAAEEGRSSGAGGESRESSEGRGRPESLGLLPSQTQAGGKAKSKAAATATATATATAGAAAAHAHAHAKGEGQGAQTPLPQRGMTFAEKQTLSINLGKLPPENLDRVVQIISERNPDLSQNADEIELDIDSLESETLWELERYVANCMKSKNKRKKGRLQPKQATPRSRVPEAVSVASQQDLKDIEDSVDILEEEEGPQGAAAGASAVASVSGAAAKLPAGNGVGRRVTPGTSGSSSSSDSSSSGSDSDSESSASESDREGARSKDTRLEASRGKSQSREGPSHSAKASEDKSTSRDAGDNVAVSADTKLEIDRKLDETPKEVKASLQADDEAAVKAALLRGKYADIILNAQKKAITTETQVVDQKQLEEIERKHKEERARLEAEARAAQESRRRKEAEAAIEARKRLEEQREAMRRALQGMAKSVELDESHAIMKDMHLLSAPTEHISGAPGRSTDLPFGGETARVPGLGPPQGMNVLEHLGLSLRDDESDGDESESEKEDNSREEVEDGEI